MYLMKCFSCLQLKSVELITKLDFSNSNLGEAFPEIWQYERTLEELHMTSTRLSSLPPQLFYCQSLRVLVLSSNNLENIPSAIGSLRQLQHLNLYRNLISSVPDTIKSCKNLTYLDLSCNNLQRLPDAITSVISLQELYLNETYLEFLPANFGRLVHLRILELRLNNLITLPKSMMRLCQLQRIDIGGNEFTELPEVIGELKQLRELWCDLNQIRRIPGNIAKLKDLIHFEANGNMLEEIPQGIFNMQKMEVISIYMNNLSTLPQVIGSMKFLVTLKCESNELEMIPDSISNLENLEELVLSHNHLRSLPETIGMLRKLRIIFLDDNLLESIPNDLCSCSDLRILSVCDNRLYQLPEDIGHLGKLTVLNLVNNRISCLPVSILCLTNLKSLWLNDNQSQPLVPLQYIDINNKKQLTCFMLPQTVGTKSLNSNSNDTKREVFDENNRLAIDYEENQIAGMSTSGVNFTKRICFAEEPIVLTTPPFDLKNMNKKSSIASAQKEKESLEVRLLRSPTPYPKELRLMAKYLRNGSKDNRQQDNMNLDVLYKNEIAEATYERLQHPTMQFQQCLPVNAIYQSQNELISNQSSSSYLKDLDEIPYKNYTFEQLNDNVQNSFEIVQQQFGQTVEPNSVITATRSNLDSVGLQSYQHPPPYHIARSFTKKSPEDLTNYDVLSQQILKNSHTQHNFVPFTPNNVANLNNSQIEETLTSTNVILDHQNNNETHEQDLMHNSNEQNMNKQIISNDSSTSSVTLLNDSLSINKSNSNLPNRSKSPWLFGTHKNPTVKQISIKWSNELGFEISTLENQDGIFVSSVMPNSNAAKLLFVKDKLLEVDGCDFSKISLSDAKQILANPCAVLNIMISRI